MGDQIVARNSFRRVAELSPRCVLPEPLATRRSHKVWSGGYWLQEWMISCGEFEGVPRSRLSSPYLDYVNPLTFEDSFEDDFAVSARRPLHSALVEAHMAWTGEHMTMSSSHAWDIYHYLTRCSRHSDRWMCSGSV